MVCDTCYELANVSNYLQNDFENPMNETLAKAEQNDVTYDMKIPGIWTWLTNKLR